jgi:hypothetical protein|tara:strand:+ start:755 stop:1033 length:279 start_codon:yes stop_codon:yes gene_type:complete
MKMKKSMKTPGFLKDNLFYLRTLTIIMGLSIALQIVSLGKDTSAESTFTNYESLELEAGELNLKVTGNVTTEAVLNLLKNASGSGILPINGI